MPRRPLFGNELLFVTDEGTDWWALARGAETNRNPWLWTSPESTQDADPLDEFESILRWRPSPIRSRSACPRVVDYKTCWTLERDNPPVTFTPQRRRRETVEAARRSTRRLPSQDLLHSDGSEERDQLHAGGDFVSRFGSDPLLQLIYNTTRSAAAVLNSRFHSPC